jgi:hypothetical protein
MVVEELGRFSVSDGRGDFEYNGSSPNGLFAKRAHLVTP